MQDDQLNLVKMALKLNLVINATAVICFIFVNGLDGIKVFPKPYAVSLES